MYEILIRFYGEVHIKTTGLFSFIGLLSALVFQTPMYKRLCSEKME